TSHTWPQVDDTPDNDTQDDRLDASSANGPVTNSVRLINPGAIAAPNEITRQLRQTCAAIFVDDQGIAYVSHVDLSDPATCYRPIMNWEAGFQAAGRLYCGSILADDLVDTIHHLRATLPEPLASSLRSAMLRLAHRCWRGEIST